MCQQHQSSWMQFTCVIKFSDHEYHSGWDGPDIGMTPNEVVCIVM